MVLFYLFIGRGLEPKQLAFSTALGIALGIFPICGMYEFVLWINSMRFLKLFNEISWK